MIDNMGIDCLENFYELIDPLNSQLTNANQVLAGYHTIKDLFKRFHVYNDGYRGGSARFEFKDGVHLTIDNTFSMIQAPAIDRIFEFSEPVFNYYNFNVEECKPIILSNKDHYINFFIFNNQMRYNIEEPINPGIENWDDGNYVKVLSELGIPRLVLKSN